MNELENFRGSIPTIEPNRLWSNIIIFKCLAKHIPEVIVFGLTVVAWIVNPEIHRMIVSRIGINQIDDTDPFHQAMRVPTILVFHYLNFLGMIVILKHCHRSQGKLHCYY